MKILYIFTVLTIFITVKSDTVKVKPKIKHLKCLTDTIPHDSIKPIFTPIEPD